MARPLRIEFPGAVYHVTARGNRGEDIFVDDEDRQACCRSWCMHSRASMPRASSSACRYWPSPVTALTKRSLGFSAASRARWPSGWQAARIGKRRYMALYRAHTESALRMSAIARELGSSVSRVSRLIARAEGAKDKG